MVAIIGAFREEIAGIRRLLRVRRTVKFERTVAYEGLYRDRQIVLARSGIGRRAAEAAAELLLRRYGIRLILSVGFAGALTERLAIGDVVLCAVLRCWCGEPLDDLRPECHSHAGLAALASRALEAAPGRLVSGVTANRAIADRETKRALHAAWGVEVVDMESYWICRIASKRKVPFLCIRSISDTLEEPLPSFIADAPDGSIRSVTKALVASLSHPRRAVSLYRNIRVAEARLTSHVRRLICEW